jgi:hypothetical protein
LLFPKKQPLEKPEASNSFAMNVYKLLPPGIEHNEFSIHGILGQTRSPAASTFQVIGRIDSRLKTSTLGFFTTFQRP